MICILIAACDRIKVFLPCRLIPLIPLPFPNLCAYLDLLENELASFEGFRAMCRGDSNENAGLSDRYITQPMEDRAPDELPLHQET